MSLKYNNDLGQIYRWLLPAFADIPITLFVGTAQTRAFVAVIIGMLVQKIQGNSDD